MKLWQKKYLLNPKIEEFTVGEDYILDQRLIYFDCLASAAHTEMLFRIGILTAKETDDLLRELGQIVELDKQGQFTITSSDEDCHTAIENHLVKKLGDSGKKIHTFRSRNDQVLAALRLYYRQALSQCENVIDDLIITMVSWEKKFGKYPIPGFSHTRKAMPSTVEMWARAFIESMSENKKMLEPVISLINQSPLGTGAGFGIPADIDREFVCDRLGFQRLQKNPLYVQNSRGKFESSIVHALSMIMFDINKMATDIIFFTMPEFGFFQLPPEYLTGSSMMPHKKNPDALEILRANYHRVISFEFSLKQITANLVSGYHRDFQLTKEPVFKSFDITSKCLEIINIIFDKMTVVPSNCQKALTDELFTAEKVYDLVRQGIPFREAYKTIARSFED